MTTYRHPAPTLPVNDSDIIVQHLDSNGGTIDDPNDWSKVVLLVGPDAPMSKASIRGKDLKCRGVIFIGATINQVGTQVFTARFGQKFNGINFCNISFAAGAPVRPYVWFSQILYDPVNHPTDGCAWGDLFRLGTRIAGDNFPYNFDEYMDFYLQKLLMTNGHRTFTNVEGTGTETHSDLMQFSSGGYNKIVIADAHVCWNGNGWYFLQAGNKKFAESGKTMGPKTCELIFDNVNHEPAFGAAGDTPAQYWLQGGNKSVWDTRVNGKSALSRGRYTSIFLRNYTARKSPNKPELRKYFNTPNIARRRNGNEVQFRALQRWRHRAPGRQGRSGRRPEGHVHRTRR